MPSNLFPPGFPHELAAEAFVHLKELAWRPPMAIKTVEWLGAHGIAVLGNRGLASQRGWNTEPPILSECQSQAR
jgi:hypothetical protein